MGQYSKAEPLFTQALQIRKEALGEDHPDYIQSLNNLAALYDSDGSILQDATAAPPGPADQEGN